MAGFHLANVVVEDALGFTLEYMLAFGDRENLDDAPGTAPPVYADWGDHDRWALAGNDGGEWTRWLRLNFHGSVRTAQRYIRLARHWPAITSDATRVSPESQTEAAAAIRRALFGNERSARRASTVPELAQGPSRTSAVPPCGPFVAKKADFKPPRVAALAVAGLRKSLVYFAEAEGAARVRIGVAVDPAARVAALQTGSPYPIRLMGTIPGGREVEASLHKRLRDYHLGGEWFFLAKPVGALIAQLTAPPDEEPVA